MTEHPYVFLVCEAAGGVARHAIDLYFGLKSRQWRPKLIMSPNRLEGMFRQELKHVPSEDLLFIPMNRGPHISDVRVLTVLRREFRAAGKNFIVHAHSTKAGLLMAALRAHAPITIYTPHAYRGVDPKLRPLHKSLIQSVERRFSRTFDRVIAVSRAEYEYAVRLGIPIQRVRHIPNGIRLNRYRIAPRRPLGPNLPLNLGFVGRLVSQKNPLLFIEVLHCVSLKVPNVRATIIGSGPYEPEMRSLAERYGIHRRIDWKGVVSAHDLLTDMDILIHTSTYEGMPYTLVESAATGVPPLSTKNDGSIAVLAEFLPDALIGSFSAEKIADKTMELVNNPVLLQDYHAALSKIAGKFSSDRMLDAITDEYRATVAKGSRVRSRSVESSHERSARN